MYYGKLDRLDGERQVMTEVYYIRSHIDPQTQETRNILLRRGSEWHAPNKTILYGRHIVMVEPLTPGAKVVELIAEPKNKGQ